MSGSVFKESLEALKGKKVLVTGASGFIGTRIVQVLKSEPGIEVFGTVNNYPNAVRMARNEVTFLKCDIADYDQVNSAVAKADVVIHCAYGKKGSFDEQAQVTIAGCNNVFKAAKENNIERVVHISTMSVYGIEASGKIDENTPRKKSDFFYADSKLECEQMAMKFAKEEGLPIAVIQPTIVYGPYSGGWTVDPLASMPKAKRYLPNNGSGICNPLYVDDLVQAILLAAVKKEAIGEVFLISGEEHVTWKDYYHYYEEMLHTEGLDFASMDELKEMSAQLGKKPGAVGLIMEQVRKERTLNFLRNFGVVKLMLKPVQALPMETKQNIRKKIFGEPPSEEEANKPQEKPTTVAPFFLYKILAAKPQASIDKARKVLGYQPQYDLKKGMAMVEKWAKWAGYLN